MAHQYFEMGILNMKFGTIALAGASLIAFATPAAAGGDGWYLGLGAGLSKMDELKYQQSTPGGKIKFDNTARFDGAVGYKWVSGLRLELEDGYASYKVSSATTPAGVGIAGATGQSERRSPKSTTWTNPSERTALPAAPIAARQSGIIERL